MRKLLICHLMPVILCSCGSVPKEINIPILVPCEVTSPTPPILKYSPPYTSIFDLVKDLKGDWLQLQAYNSELEASLKVCK